MYGLINKGGARLHVIYHRAIIAKKSTSMAVLTRLRVSGVMMMMMMMMSDSIYY